MNWGKNTNFFQVNTFILRFSFPQALIHIPPEFSGIPVCGSMVAVHNIFTVLSKPTHIHTVTLVKSPTPTLDCDRLASSPALSRPLSKLQGAANSLNECTYITYNLFNVVCCHEKLLRFHVTTQNAFDEERDGGVVVRPILLTITCCRIKPHANQQQ